DRNRSGRGAPVRRERGSALLLEVADVGVVVGLEAGGADVGEVGADGHQLGALVEGEGVAGLPEEAVGLVDGGGGGFGVLGGEGFLHGGVDLRGGDSFDVCAQVGVGGGCGSGGPLGEGAGDWEVAAGVDEGDQVVVAGQHVAGEQLVAAERFDVHRDADLLQHGLDHLGLADRKSTRLNSSHVKTSYAVFCLKKKKE